MIRTKTGKLLLVVAAFAMLAAACGGGSTAAPDACTSDPFGCVEVKAGSPITVGTLLVISGPNAALGQDSQNGVVLAADYLDGTFDAKSGQIDGHDIAFNNQDDGCSAEGGQTGAQALASNPDIVGVIGTSCSSAAQGVADKILSDKGIVLISPSNTGPALTSPSQHQPFYLRTAHNDKLQGAAVADFAYNELGARTAATIHDGSPYADGLQQVFADTFTQLGGTITAQEAIQVGETDFTSVLTSIGTSAPDVLYYPIFAAEGALITQQARQTAGLENATLIGSDGMTSTDFLNAAGDAANGMYLSGPDLTAFGGDQSFYTNDFLPAYVAQFGAEPAAVFHAHAYDATNMLFAAIKKVAIDSKGDPATDSSGTIFIPRTALKDALFATSNFPGITGNLTCNADGDCQTTATIAMVQVENGQMTDPVWSKQMSLGS
jgi:branched-chain amino acid transport system substrate-binding protein